MTDTLLRAQRECISAIAIPDKRYGKPAYDGEVPASLRVDLAIDTGSFQAGWVTVRDLVGRRAESAAPEAVAETGRYIQGSFSVAPTPENLKIVSNWGITLFASLTLPWVNLAPQSREPITNGETASWTFDYLERPDTGQAVRYFGVVFTGVAIGCSRDTQALRLELTFTARTRNSTFYTYPHDRAFDWTEPTGRPFLLKNAYIYVGDLQLTVDSFGVRIENPCRFDYFGEDGLIRRFGMDSQSAEVDVTFLAPAEIVDEIDGWMTTSRWEADFRGMFVHPNAVRRRVAVALNAGCGFIPLLADYVASPATPKTDYTRFRDQMIFALEGTQLDSPLNTRHVEVHKVDASFVTSPSGLTFSSEPTEANTRHSGLRKGFAAGAFIYTIATEIVVPRVTCVETQRLYDGPGRVRKMRARFAGMSDGAGGGGQLADSFNPALKTEIRT